MRICETRCCGVKELDGLDNHHTPEEAMRGLCGIMPGGAYSSRFDYENDPEVEGGQIRKTIVTPPKLKPNYSLFTFTGVVTRRQADHSSARADNYAGAFADYIGNHSLGPVTASGEVRSRRTTNGIRLWVWEFDLDQLQAWWLERCPKPAGVADVKIPPQKPLSEDLGSINSYSFNISFSQMAEQAVLNVNQQLSGAYRGGGLAYRRAVEEELRRLQQENARANYFGVRRMDPNNQQGR